MTDNEGSDKEGPRDAQQRARDEHSLDPGESWGQGPDASHPESSAEDFRGTAAQDRATPSGEGSDAQSGADRLAEGAERAAEQPDYGRDGS